MSRRANTYEKMERFTQLHIQGERDSLPKSGPGSYDASSWESVIHSGEDCRIEIVMSPTTPPTSRPNGRALIVGQPAFRILPTASLQRQGYTCTEVDDPYQAMIQLCRRPLFYSAVVVSLNSLYREELALISSVKHRFTHIDIWLSDTDGRQAALAEAMRLGADGLFADDDLHRIATGIHAPPAQQIEADARAEALDETAPSAPTKNASEPVLAEKSADPLLTAEELRALLQDSPHPT
jgi:hypothetical protein